MTPEQWQKVEAVLQGALDRPAHERASFIDEACSGDDQLLAEATSLVDAYDQAGDFIEEPAITLDAHVLVGDQLDKIDSEVGPYKILERLGVGGMGEVYLAQDSRLDRLVALKILPAYFASDETRLRRFQREARAASALNHPNILTIHEVGSSGGVPYISTEFIDGVTIRELASKQLSFDEILNIAEQVASALAAAHTAGIVHRDIKPENIMRRPDGLVKILDFGIAKLLEPESPDHLSQTQPGTRTHTEAGLVMGTVNYMSPEQARALEVDERTDVWSFGVVLYEMLTGQLPFKGATRMDTMVAILDREPAPMDEIPGSGSVGSHLLKEIAGKCLCKEMSERYRSANELVVALTRAKSATGEFKLAAAVDLETVRSPAGRQPKTWLALGAVALLLVTLFGAVLYRRNNAARVAKAPAAVTTKLYSQMSEAERLNFIDEQEQRISRMMGDSPVKLNDDALRAIKRFVDRYAAWNAAPDELGAAKLSVVYGRARPYVPLIAKSFVARKVPVIVGIYLPMIESAYRNCYENNIGAKGLYQFMPQTAAHYGVAPEDMCDVEKMTPVAAHYIADRMAELGEDSESMTLVLLSYNRGEDSVRDNLRRLRGAENYERNFWTLFAHRDELDDGFRNEGARYVPNFFAAAIIGENPEVFELPGPALSKLVGSEQ